MHRSGWTEPVAMLADALLDLSRRGDIVPRPLWGGLEFGDESPLRRKAAEVAVDYHTVENRNKRKSMQQRRNTLAQQMKVIEQNAQPGQQSLQQLYASVESNLALAKHAEEWEWKEAKPQEPETAV